MPRKPVAPSLADSHAAPGGSAAVDKALSLLNLFRPGDKTLGLTDFAERANLYKSTVLRLLASLEHAGLVYRHPDGRYGLGPAIARLNAIYTTAFSMEPVVMPVLKSLVELTHESAAFHIRQGDLRLCLYRVDSPQVVRDHTKAGDVMPLDRGAGGRVLCAYAGARGALYDRIRRDQCVVLVGDRMPELAGVSAPVFGVMDRLVGALTLTMPAHRVKDAHVPHVTAAARRLTALLGGHYPAPAGSAGGRSASRRAPRVDVSPTRG